MATGGSIESVSLAGRVFAVAADADTQRKLGGWENEVQMNGDGSGRLIKTRVAAQFAGLQLSVDDARGDDEFLTEIKNGRDFVPGVVTYASGQSYSGLLQIVGEYVYNSQASTATVDLHGPGSLTRI